MANYSLSEIDALARKATRGAGYSWGIAEEVGKSVRWLSAYGLPGPEVLAQHLQLMSGEHQNYTPNLNDSINEANLSNDLKFENKEHPMCSIYCGTLINDLGYYLNNNKKISFSNMLFPLLALAAAARTAEAYDIAISYSFSEITILCNANGIAIKDTPHLLSDITSSSFEDVKRTYAEPDTVDENKSHEVNCSRIENDFENTHFPTPYSQSISKEAILILEQFAHETYAPDTEESRLKGAG